jgi:hypothetical protein
MPTAAIVRLAKKASRIHIRTAGKPDYSATSKEGSWPIDCLRAGKAFSRKLEKYHGSDYNSAWEVSNTEVLGHLTPRTDPGTRDLKNGPYHACSNVQGLHLLITNAPHSTWDGPRCSWTFPNGATGEAVEVYLNCSSVL